MPACYTESPATREPTSHVSWLASAYLSRRSPWGPPWWIYAVSFGALNIVRHAIVLMAPEIPQPIRISAFVGTAVLVIVVVNAAAVVLQRASHMHGRYALSPMWPFARSNGEHVGRAPQRTDAAEPRRSKISSPTEGGHTVNDQQLRGDHATSKWAPWWVYVVIIVGANSLRRAMIPTGDANALADVGIALGLSALLFATITAVHRATNRHESRT
jgi:hypothetical protein